MKWNEVEEINALWDKAREFYKKYYKIINRKKGDGLSELATIVIWDFDLISPYTLKRPILECNLEPSELDDLANYFLVKARKFIGEIVLKVEGKGYASETPNYTEMVDEAIAALERKIIHG